MPFYFRRSKSFGPLRINLSKSGIGASVGVKGARIGTGPRGPYVAGGRGGVYYRQQVGARPPSPGGPRPRPQLQFAPPSGGNHPRILPQELAEHVVPASGARPGTIPWAIAGLLIVAGYVLSRSSMEQFSNGPGPVLLMFGIVLALVLGLLTFLTRDGPARLHYDLAGAAEARHEAIMASLDALATANALWRVTATRPAENERNPIVKQVVDRSPCTLTLAAPPGLEPDIEIYCLVAPPATLYFFPAHIFIPHGDKFLVLPYEQLQLSLSATNFVEAGQVPGDAARQGTTWLFTNLDGTPDRRRASNRQIPVLRYAEVSLKAANGLDILLQVSSVEAATSFVSEFNAALGRRPTSSSQGASNAQAGGQPGGKQNASGRPNDGGTGPQRPQSAAASPSDPYSILGVARTASAAEVNAAYRHLAAQYHPDKVATMAPEFRELAERKMKEINAAYEVLKRQANAGSGVPRHTEPEQSKGQEKPSPTPSPSAAKPPPGPEAAERAIGSIQKLTYPSGKALLLTVHGIQDGVQGMGRQAQAQGRWVVLDWEVTNVGNVPVDVNPLFFLIQTTSGFLIKASYQAGLANPRLSLGKLAPGQRVRGYLPYDVPLGARLQSAIYQPTGEQQYPIAELLPTGATPAPRGSFVRPGISAMPSPVGTGWRRYISASGFRLDAPADWVCNSKPDEPEGNLHLLSQDHQLACFGQSKVSPGGGSMVFLRDWLQRMETTNAGRGFTIEVPAEITIVTGAVTAARAEARIANGAAGFSVQHYYTAASSSRSYSFFITGPSNAAPSVQAIIKAVANSFAIEF